MAAAVYAHKRPYLFEDEYPSYRTQKRARLHAPPVIFPQPKPKITDPISPPPQIQTKNGGGEWVEFFLKEMLSAASIEDAKSRAARAVEALEQAVAGRTREDAARRYGEESAAAKERVEALGKENAVLKRAVGIQQKRMEEKEKELQAFKNAASLSQDKVKILELKNYGLALHLNHALGCGNSFTASNRDVF
ncbi:hypothetical protein Tsubulata_008841 [Turnera subulata]|uniref:Uncharacterized protein n=1 Tax=Turnera subulata TaxID=218843 RepID=A0A9Q0F8M8_9ROSI|nr:hypothetical protein Tsubulata_008841 [Turnera subulata]